MHITKITLKNFQIYKSLNLTLDNFTAIIGPSSSGKSAILRALYWLFYGDWDATYPNSEEEETAVAIQLEDGTIWARFRKGKRNWAIHRQPGKKPITYQDFGEVIPGIMDDLNVRPIKIGNTKVNLNFSMQDDPLFMVHESKPTKAQWIGRLYGAHIINQMLRLMNTDKRRIEADKRAVEDEEERLRAELEQYANLDAETEALERVSELLNRLDMVLDSRKKMAVVLQDMEAIKQGRGILDADTDAMRDGLERLEKLVIAHDTHKRLVREAAVLKDSLYLNADTASIRADLMRLEDARGQLEAHSALKAEKNEAEVELRQVTGEVFKLGPRLKKLRSDMKKQLFEGGKCPLCQSKPKRLSMTNVTANLNELVRSDK